MPQRSTHKFNCIIYVNQYADSAAAVYCIALYSVIKKGKFFEVSTDLLCVKLVSLALQAEIKVYLDL